ncbi:MAG: DNA-deoxyinosine glycosylase [Pseudazoarcus pumilus]|nr:DNA-deoxyinosine glycosylase [Pseudazoarcus pumilus]
MPTTRLQAFAPLARADAHTLILGSMPGTASLAASEYYAHPRNLFWPVVAELLGFDARLPYAGRVEALAARGYALWDVLGGCRRQGSLDSAIEPESMEINDFQTFFRAHPRVERVFCNGSFAATLFRRRVLPVLGESAGRLQLHRLPSTSPAHAGMTAEAKRAAWAAILR